MALPALATVERLAVWLGETIPADDERAQAVLAHASTLVRSRAGATWVDAEGSLESDIPDGIGEVTVMVAARAWLNPTSAGEHRTGPFSASDLKGFELTDAETAMVDAAIGTRRIRGLGTISTTRGDLETPAVVDVTGGRPLPVDLPTGLPTRSPA